MVLPNREKMDRQLGIENEGMKNERMKNGRVTETVEQKMG